MYQKQCELCLSSFSSPQPNTLVCSESCRLKRIQNITGRKSYQTSLSAGTVGAISEMAVALDLMQKGYAVFRALSPSCKSDLVAMKLGVILTVEVRTGYISASQNVTFPHRKDDEADIYAAYVPREQRVYYFYPDKKTPFVPCEKLN